MTKGGTGDVLAGLIAALACKNDPFLATIAGSFINKKAGDGLYRITGPYFNASDLADEIPQTMARILKIT
jgi:NAD(P)H-hydrate epimerase